jgi:hypothetical protein
LPSLVFFSSCSVERSWSFRQCSSLFFCIFPLLSARSSNPKRSWRFSRCWSLFYFPAQRSQQSPKAKLELLAVLVSSAFVFGLLVCLHTHSLSHTHEYIHPLFIHLITL